LEKKHKIFLYFETFWENIRIFISNFISYYLFTLFSIFLPERTSQGSSILFINTLFLGDITVCLPFLATLKAQNKYSNYYFLVREEYVTYLQSTTLDFNYIGWRKSKYKFNLFYRIKLLNQIRLLKIDTAINLSQERGILSDEMTLLSKARNKLAIKRNSKYILSSFINVINSKYTFILSNNIKNEYKRFEIFLQTYFGIELLKNYRIFKDSFTAISNISMNDTIVIAPFSSDKNKDWGISNFRNICIKLSTDYKIILLGTPEQNQKINMICEGLNNVFNFVNKIRLSEIPALISCCSIYIGLDSGLSHIALLTKAKSITIIGGGSFGRFFPLDEPSNMYFLFLDLNCFQCNWHCIFKINYCLALLSVDKVYYKVIEVLRKKS
jgi:ADP-heptose:LPS heptosyltransferase